MNIRQMDDTYIAHTYARFPIEITSGSGSVVFDSAGKRYIDMGSGIAVNSFGLSDPVWIKAVTEQMSKVTHTSNLYYTAPDANLARMLCERTGLRKVFFGNSGAEANECAIKVARKYAAQRHGAEYSTIVTLWNSFHGRTLTTLSATGQEHYHELYQPLTPGFVHALPNDTADIDRIVAENKVAGILVECVQGEGGVKPVDPDYLMHLQKIADDQDIALMIDEVQTGNGRTGTLYAYEQAGLRPDIVTTAKGLGGGLPIGACLIGEKCADVLQPGDHGSTFGGNPIVCAGAISILERIDDDLLCEVRNKSRIIFDKLGQCDAVKEVTGLGLMIGLLPKYRSARTIADE